MRSSKLPIMMLIALTLVVPALMVGNSGAQITYGLSYDSLRVDTRIENHYAMTTFTAEITNTESESTDTTFQVLIPEDAMLTNLSITIDGTTSYAAIAPRSEADRQYDDATSSGETATQLRASPYDKSIFFMDLNIKSGKTISFSIRYEQVVVKRMHNYTYILPFNTLSINNLFSDVHVLLDIKGLGDLTPMNIEKGTLTPAESWVATNHIRYEFEASQIRNTDTLGVVYKEEAPPINGTLNAYIDDRGGYFMHVFSPQLEELGDYLPKDIIFILDRSGSMGGTKIEQLKEAFTEIVGQVNNEDRFNIISFSSDTDQWKEEMVTADPVNKDDSALYIQQIDPMGSTNIDLALSTGLEMFQGDIEAVPIIVFLTDGLPTTGEKDPDTIRNNIQYLNEKSVSIYSLGFGDDVDFNFLSALSLENRGFSVKIPESQDASELLQGFYETISVPLLQNLYFNYSSGTQEILPEYKPSLFAGSEAVVVGRFDRTKETIVSTVSGTTSDGPRVFEESWKVDQNSEMEFIPRLWAHRQIQHYMERMVVEGETEYLQEQIINLALDYSFVTQYTSFILVIEEPEDQVELPDDDTSEDDEPGTTTNLDGSGDQDGTSDPSIRVTDDDDDVVGDDDDDDVNYYDPTIDPPTDSADDGINWPWERDGPISEGKTEGEKDSTIPIFIFLLIFIVIPIIVGLVIFGYSRIRREDLLNQENRKKIYEYITGNPGAHFRGLQRAVDLEVGVLSHHLNVLEKEQLIVSEQDGNNRCFWAAGVKHDTDKVRLSRIQENILKEIHEEPGITQSQIARKIGVSRKVVFYHVKFLRNAGVVKEEKIQRKAHYYERD